MMKSSRELPEEVIARLQRIQANVDSETALINELLELSRIRTRPQQRRPTDMGALMHELAGTFEFELKSRHIELAVADGMPTIVVETSRIRQVFQNLIDNAIKYMHRETGGRISVGYERVDGHHRFHVADNGPGIPPAEQRKVFCVFRRAESAAAAGVQGKGVGLALVKSVLANYDGRAWLESEVGQGTTFYVSLDAGRCVEGPDDERRETQDAVAADHHPAGR
jgi:signal transduction histidine kinase